MSSVASCISHIIRRRLTNHAYRARPTPSDLAELHLIVEADLTELSAWFTSNGLKVNPSKTELMLFGTAPSLKKGDNAPDCDM